MATCHRIASSSYSTFFCSGRPKTASKIPKCIPLATKHRLSIFIIELFFFFTKEHHAFKKDLSCGHSIHHQRELEGNKHFAFISDASSSHFLFITWRREEEKKRWSSKIQIRCLVSFPSSLIFYLSSISIQTWNRYMKENPILIKSCPGLKSRFVWHQ